MKGLAYPLSNCNFSCLKKLFWAQPILSAVLLIKSYTVVISVSKSRTVTPILFIYTNPFFFKSVIFSFNLAIVSLLCLCPSKDALILLLISSECLCPVTTNRSLALVYSVWLKPNNDPATFNIYSHSRESR